MTAKTVLKDVSITDANRSIYVPLITPAGQPGEAVNELFRFRFGADLPAAVGAIDIPLRSTVGSIEEIWTTHSPTCRLQEDGVHVAMCDEYLFVYMEAELTVDKPIRITTRHVYGQLLAAAARHEYPHLLRAWNYFPNINLGEGDAEQYRQFSMGRAEAFHAASHDHDTFPAGTAIGVRHGEKLQVALLCSRSAAQMVENPRQTSAYQYPRDYGPVGPSFARASQLSTSHTRQMWVSGTASIVGSESCHIDNEVQQLEETLKNIRELVCHGGCLIDAAAPPVFRVYLRQEIDRQHICRRIQEEFGNDASITILTGDICRTELLLEIECIFWAH